MNEQEREAFEAWFANFRHGWKTEKDVALDAFKAGAALAAKAVPADLEKAHEARRQAQSEVAYLKARLASARLILMRELKEQGWTPPAPAPEATPHTEFVLNELRSALNAMLTFFGMDEDESNKEVFDMARQAYDYAQIVMRPLEPWERQSLKDLRDCVGRWHEKAVAKGYDGVESMCDTAPAQAQQAHWTPEQVLRTQEIAAELKVKIKHKPLTDEQIDAMAHKEGDYDSRTCCWSFNGDTDCRYNLTNFARAIERAHGIGASTKVKESNK